MHIFHFHSYFGGCFTKRYALFRVKHFLNAFLNGAFIGPITRKLKDQPKSQNFKKGKEKYVLKNNIWRIQYNMKL